MQVKNTAQKFIINSGDSMGLILEPRIVHSNDVFKNSDLYSYGVLDKFSVVAWVATTGNSWNFRGCVHFALRHRMNRKKASFMVFFWVCRIISDIILGDCMQS